MSDPLLKLPHGPEFRYLDRVTEFEGGKSGTGEYLVKGTEPFLRGHFPGEPIFPGVLLLEAAAQLAGVVAQSDPAHPAMPGLKLTAIRAAKILGTARPGETIVIRVRVTGRFQNLVQADAIAEVNGGRVLEATVTLSGETRILESS